MPERTGYEPGTPCWVDIGTDVPAAHKFYGELFGWTTEDAGPVEETGGQVLLDPMDVMTAGRMAHFQDPEGAVISAWQPGDHIGAGVGVSASRWRRQTTTTRRRSVRGGTCRPRVRR